MKNVHKKRALDEEMASKGYITSNAASEMMRSHKSTVYDLCDRGELEFMRIGGGKKPRLYIKRTSIKEYMGPEATKLLKL